MFCLSAYRWCRCTVGGNKCSLLFLWAERPITVGVYLPVKVPVSGSLCVYLTHDSLTGLMGLTEINKNNTTIAGIVKLTTNRTGNDRAEDKNGRRWRDG